MNPPETERRRNAVSIDDLRTVMLEVHQRSQSAHATAQASNDPMWLKVLYRFGVPSAIALYLTWFGTGQLSASVKDLGRELAEHVSASRIATESIEHLLQQQTAQQDIIIDLMKQTCLQGAHTPDDRRACQDASRRTGRQP